MVRRMGWGLLSEKPLEAQEEDFERLAAGFRPGAADLKASPLPPAPSVSSELATASTGTKVHQCESLHF